MQLFKLASFFAAATLAAAQLRVTSPSSSIWWVARSTNVLEWTCRETQIPNFTVLISNLDPNILVQPLAIIAQQNNYDCSILVTQDQSNQAAGTGYQILLANPLNNTDVYARSEPFEIKPLGSLYPTQAAASSAAAASSSAAAATGTSGNSNSGALSLGVRNGLLGGIAASFLGLAGGVVTGLL